MSSKRARSVPLSARAITRARVSAFWSMGLSVVVIVRLQLQRFVEARRLRDRLRRAWRTGLRTEPKPQREPARHLGRALVDEKPGAWPTVDHRPLDRELLGRLFGECGGLAKPLQQGQIGRAEVTGITSTHDRDENRSNSALVSGGRAQSAGCLTGEIDDVIFVVARHEFHRVPGQFRNGSRPVHAGSAVNSRARFWHFELAIFAS